MRDFVRLIVAMDNSEAVFLDARAQLRQEYACHAREWLEAEPILEIAVNNVRYFLDSEDRERLMPIIFQDDAVPSDLVDTVFDKTIC